MIQTIVFDLDDTLLWDKKSVQKSFQDTCQQAQETYPEIDPTTLEESVREAARELYASYETYEFTQMIGINPFEGLWGDFDDKINTQFRQMQRIVPHYRREAWTKGLQKIGINDPALGQTLGETFPTMRRQNPFTYADTFDVLDTLVDQYQLVMLTNGSPTLQNEKLEMTPELVPYFDYIIVSGAFGRGKPDPSIFEHVLFLVGQSAQEAIMVGDNLNTDILGANRVGMRNVWINRENRKAVEVGQAEKADTEPTHTIASLSELPSLVQAMQTEK